MSDSKVCRDCGEDLPVSAFSVTRGGRYLRQMCKVCYRVYDAQYKRKKRLSDPEWYARQLEANKKYRERYSEGYRQHRLKKRERHRHQYFSDLSFRCRQIISAARRRAEKKGLEFEIDAETLEAIIQVQGYKCSVTGMSFDLSESTKYLRSPLAPSIDRKDSDKGYTWDNIQIVVAWYNIFKNEWSDEDARHFISVAYMTMFGGA